MRYKERVAYKNGENKFLGLICQSKTEMSPY